ncbi:hypothetical protein ACTXGQ_08275 [Marinobacter sp. 1Y8]
MSHSILNRAVRSGGLMTLMALLTPLAHATDPADNKLLDLLSGQNLAVSADPQVVILGGADAALSRGAWSEEAVAAFTSTFGYQPVVLPLTYKLKQQPAKKEDDDKHVNRVEADFNHTPENAIYYVYVNIPETGDIRGVVLPPLEGMLTDDFQAQLNAEGYAALPEDYLQLWRVQLGLAPSRFSGGYL